MKEQASNRFINDTKFVAVLIVVVLSMGSYIAKQEVDGREKNTADIASISKTLFTIANDLESLNNFMRNETMHLKTRIDDLYTDYNGFKIELRTTRFDKNDGARLEQRVEVLERKMGVE